MMEVKAVLYFSLLIVPMLAWELGEICFTGTQSIGRCVILDNCPELIQNLKQSHNSEFDHSRAIDTLRQLQCGFSMEGPLVCCLHLPWRQPNSTGTDRFQKLGEEASVRKSQEPIDKEISQLSSEKPAMFFPAQAFVADKMLLIGNITPDESPKLRITPERELTQTTNNSSATEIDDEEDLSENCGRVLMNRYFQGYETELDDFTSMALIEYATPQGQVFGCGGSLISNQYVLTAGRCVSFLKTNVRATSVRLGEYNFATEVDCIPDNNDKSTYCADKFIDVPIRELIVHPRASSVGYNRAHDIALIRLAKKITFTHFIQSICLPTAEPIKQRFYTSGWGTYGYRQESKLKYMSVLTVIDKRTCGQKFAETGVRIYDQQICAGAGRGEKPCVGDLGGPIMGMEKYPDNTIRMTAFGILTVVHPKTGACNSSGWPGIYTKVLDYVPWIKSEIRRRGILDSDISRIEGKFISNATVR